MYRYVHNSPVNATDPFGLAECTDDAGNKCDCCEMRRIEIRVDQPRSKVSVKASLLDWDALHAFFTTGDAPETGHAFIFIDNAEGGYMRGFYPMGGSWRGKAGAVRADNEHRYTHFKAFRACPKSVNKIKIKIGVDEKHPPIYDIDNINCTSYVCNLLNYAGFKGPKVQLLLEPNDLISQPGFVEVRE